MSVQAQAQKPQQKAQVPIQFPSPSDHLERMVSQGSEAISILRRLIEDTSAIMGGGSKSKDRCLGCVSKGVHNTQPRRCKCSCHEARELIQRIDQGA